MSAKGFAMTAATHGIALGIGWAIWTGGGIRPPRDSENSPAGMPSVRTRSREREKISRNGPESEARELIATLRKSQAESVAASREWKQPAPDPVAFGLIDSLKIPADFQKAFEDLLAAATAKGTGISEADPEAIALGYRWLERDPEGFFSILASEAPTAFFLKGILPTLTPEIYRRRGITEALMVFSKPGRVDYYRSGPLAAAVAAKMDGGALTVVKQSVDGQTWRYFIREVSAKWPAANPASLLKLAVDLDEPGLLLGIKNEESNRGSFLAGLLADQSLPGNFRKNLGANGDIQNALRWDPSTPLDIRLQQADPRSLIQHDVSMIFAEKRDWPFAVRRGEATAEDVLNAVTAEMPELAAKEPALLRKFLFGELAEENPAAAMTLLKDEPESVRNETALLASRTHFENIEPDKFLEMVQQIPSDTPAAWEGRLDAWNLRSFTNNGRLHEGYVDWVEKLPPGLDREMALYSLARATPDTALAARLRAQVTDPQLQKRIATHQ